MASQQDDMPREQAKPEVEAIERKRVPPKKKVKKRARRRNASDKKAFLRKMIIIGVITALFLLAALMIASSFFPEYSALAVPGKALNKIIAPVQNFFSNATDSVVDYLRKLKIRGEIEYEYGELLMLLDEYADKAALADEYKKQIDELYDLMDEMERNPKLDPITAAVIGHDTSNYFAVLTIDVGSNQGVSDFMAVVKGGGLVGYTYDTQANSAKVRCVIDSDATVSAKIQSSDDQGSVKGTLGIDGKPMCRMYYLPENTLSRPGDMVVTSGVGMEFIKGIPIGYVRESTRGLEENKSYIVIEPIVDFQHIETVVVYRYIPYYAESASIRVTGVQATFVPIPSAEPAPTFVLTVADGFSTSTPDPNRTPSPSPTPSPTPSPSPTPTPSPDPNQTPKPPNFVYNPPGNMTPEPTREARPTATPSPTPRTTFDPGNMTVEEDE